MLFRTKVVVISVIAASFCLSLTAKSQTKVPLSHEAMWMMKRLGAPNPSPDGKWTVFSLIEPAYDEKDQVFDLWIVPTDGSAKPRRQTFSEGGESVVWSPDSRQIAFSSKRSPEPFEGDGWVDRTLMPGEGNSWQPQWQPIGVTLRDEPSEIEK